ncbi:response regulator [Iningainema tapete]|uniref:Response regulator n=1 Tax=Iningainema tapete BLCC-T55 TaxID=2748662 RepID=A0A8J6XM54_9CYAN|nr:response regulator [Iningainema tapete]MBD2774244.1 response regulator [Iningainema tapete BLCC-T55]
MRILIVEDDELTALALTKVLEHQNYAVEVATDGELAWDLVEAFDYDLIMLDVMLPKLDGISFCRLLRSHDYKMPVLLLTGRDSSHDKAIGLDAGADDYVVKPFDSEELVARVRALLRRGNSTAQPILEWGSLRLDPSCIEVHYEKHLVQLTAKEYALLELFMRNPRRVFSCSAILDRVWSFDHTPGEEAVRTQIKGLRQKLKAAGAPADLVETVYGIGYRLKQLSTDVADNVSTVEQIQQQTLAALGGVWRRFQGKISQQVSVLEQAATDALQDTLSQELHAIAEQQAHTLAGSLGTFGFSSGSQLARKIEHLLQAGKCVGLKEGKHLRKLVLKLRQEIEQSPLVPVSATQTNSDERFDTDTEAVVMVVDDDPQILATLQTLLEPWGLQVITLNDPRCFWETLEASLPDLLILDIQMPHLSGVELCQMVRNEPRTCALPVLFLTAHTDAATVNQVFAIGADDFVSKPIVGPELVTRIINRLERIKLLRSLASIDPLTTVFNRYRATQDLDKFLHLSQRHNQPLCLAILDLDNVKLVNNTFGHPTGDAVLRQFGQLLRQSFPSEDIVGRWGGEKFVVGIYAMTRSDGVLRLKEVLKTLHEQEFLAPDGSKFRVTFSAGVAQYPEDGTDLQSLYQVADAALHQAHAAGRNCVLPAAPKPELIVSNR